MTRIRQCRAREIFEDPCGPELIAEYARECANALIGKPAPRLDIYENLEASGMGQCFAAYEEEQGHKLVGFAMVVVAVVPHYSLSVATLESIFTSRDTNCGGQLLDAIESYAANLGAEAVIYTAPLGSRMAKLMFLCGDLYQHTNHVFTRRLRRLQ